MRVAFLTHEPFYPPSGGGSAEALYMVEEFVRRGYEVHLFCPEVANRSQVEKRFSISLHPFQTWQMGRYTSLRNFKYLLYPIFLQKLVERVARGKFFDLIFSQHAIAAVTAGRLKKKWRVPVVMNFLDYLTAFMETWPAYIAPPPALAVLKRFELSLPRRYGVDALLTVSDTLADYFTREGFPREKTLPIYYGFDSQLFPFSRRVRPAEEAPVVVMHGSLDQHHLGPIAVRAIQEVSTKIPETVFRFVGHRTGSLNRFLDQIKVAAPQARVESTGFVPYTEISQHLSTADVGIVPYEESTGTHCAFVAKIVEYLGIGLPVVSTSLNSAQRYFHNEPTVRFAGFDGGTFAETILKTLRNPLPEEFDLARAASERVRRELDWRAICRKAIDFVEDIPALAKS